MNKRISGDDPVAPATPLGLSFSPIDIPLCFFLDLLRIYAMQSARAVSLIATVSRLKLWQSLALVCWDKFTSRLNVESDIQKWGDPDLPHCPRSRILRQALPDNPTAATHVQQRKGSMFSIREYLAPNHSNHSIYRNPECSFLWYSNPWEARQQQSRIAYYIGLNACQYHLEEHIL